ncbi:protein YqbG [Gracilibacillus alcaliphilus]|uniref:protein YqbG n=1 Tax=Gracilibacillus alcaliphilus TaxID=1401441 RepID=UPI0019570003|nr:DUF3199 family protein [Gracilibacillus alcaliphilus]MBM7678967.1 hypothetical protein [Gracilibacillus alcaliphilus]
MAITPEDLRNYTTFESVKKRPDAQLEMDILEAEIYINNKIEKPLDEYDELPPELKLAWLKVAQFYALINGDESMAKGYKSERIGDYSYTLSDGSSLTMPDISSLLEDFLPDGGNNGFFMRIRPL